MEWNAIYYNMNSKKIEVFNIFRHGRFFNDVFKSLEKCENIDDFSAELKSHLMYYFWCKSEWEVLIYPWLDSNEKGIKIDVYWQVMNNWQQFLDYVWSFKK